MDSITQIILGAAVGEAAIGRQVGRKAALWGAVCGTLPDLDVFIPLGSAVADFTYHRSFSHSLLVLAALTPLMVWLIRKIHPRDAPHRRGWYLLVYASFATHVLLDSFTIYGTQIFWPVNATPMGWGSLFIIDPVFTLPLAIGVGAVALLRRRPRLGYRINAACLALSTLYLGWSFAAKHHVQALARESLAAQGIEYRQLLTLPGPFNTILWRLVVMTEDGYYEGWYSLLDAEPAVDFDRYQSEAALLAGLEDHWPVARLKWFTKGFYKVHREADDILMTDLRMGIEGAYVFRFKVGEIGNPHPIPTVSEYRPVPRDLGRLRELWVRLKGRDEP